MRDIDQFRELLGGNTESINMDSVVVKDNPKHFNRWTGIVVNNDDPEKLGRLQIKIYGYYDDLDINNIPWAIPEYGSWVNTKGSLIIPELDTILRGYFEDGDDMKPIYDSLAFNSSYGAMSGNYSEYQRRTEDYPNSVILFESDYGDYLIMNKKTGEFTFTHHTGAQTFIDGQGTINIQTGMSLSGMGDLNINVSGNCTINSVGSMTISAMDNVELHTLPGKSITLGDNLMIPGGNLVNNLPNCLICGSPHSLGNTQVKV